MEAREACGEDEFCLFDVAATKNVEIGMATMQGGENFDRFMEMSVPSEFLWPAPSLPATFCAALPPNTVRVRSNNYCCSYL